MNDLAIVSGRFLDLIEFISRFVPWLPVSVLPKNSQLQNIATSIISLTNFVSTSVGLDPDHSRKARSRIYSLQT